MFQKTPVRQADSGVQQRVPRKRAWWYSVDRACCVQHVRGALRGHGEQTNKLPARYGKTTYDNLA
eukprot:3870959-Rhodomonas_salina.1